MLFCVKTALPSKHHVLTSKDLAPILENLRLISAAVPVVIRYVVIPGMNDLPEDITALSEILLTLPHAVAVELLPYHCLGEKKWELLGKHYRLAGIRPADKKDMLLFAQGLKEHGLKVLYMDK